MKSSLQLLFLILFGTLCSYGQGNKNAGLSLTGTIVGLNAVAECRGTDGRLLVQIELSMQFRNSSDRPLIVFNPEAFQPYSWRNKVGRTQILLLRSLPSTTDKVSERMPVDDIYTDNCRSSDPNYYYDNYDPVADFIGRINLPAPPPAQFVMIEPRGYYEFREGVTVDTGYEIAVKLGKSLKEARIRPEHPALQIQYRLSLRSNAKGEGLLQALQSRWKSVGDLILDGNGDFAVTSDPIINTGSE